MHGIMTAVMTVLGPIDSGDLGFTLTHEHFFINLLREYRGEGLLNDPELAKDEVLRFKAAGGRTVVDCTSIGLQRDPAALRRLAQETGLNVIMGCGHYRDPYIDRGWLDSQSANKVADLIVRDIDVGADGTGIRAGIIGEVGCDKRYVSAAEERSLRAAARAHLQTGLTITTHAARWPVGLPQLEILRSEGVDPARVVIGHCDTVPSYEYHEEVARLGAWVQFDTIRGESEYDIAHRVRMVLNLVSKGFIDRILLSHDVCLRSMLRICGGGGYDLIPTVFLPRLREAGLSAEQLARITVDNPRRALTGEED
ncbi:phosphotriesterase-related protein [bacterium]|nr:MAG: phosphotriesterase-related protein [bacterium]